MNQKCKNTSAIISLTSDYANCSYTTTRAIPATGHTEVTDAAVAPTCTATGLTEGKHCSVCNTVTKAQQTVAATGHSYTSVVTAPTCTVDGYTTYTCSKCSSSYESDVVTKLGHNYTSVVTAPTCTADGYTTHTCSRCSNTYTDSTVAALGHSFTSYTHYSDENCVSNAKEIATCDRCTATDIRDILNTQLKHTEADANGDNICDNCGKTIGFRFDPLEYPDEAIVEKSTASELRTYLSRADKNDDVYASCQGYDDNGIIASPYFDVKIEGTAIPVYGTVVYVPEDTGHGHGALHSFSEIYINANALVTEFDIELTSVWNELNITSAEILSEPGYTNGTLKVQNGKVTATLNGMGVYTFVFNGQDADYVFTLTVRQYYNDDDTIALLEKTLGYTVYVIDGYVDDFDYLNINSTMAPHGGTTEQYVIYLKQGAYVSANHKFDINNDTDNAGKAEDGAAANNGIGLNRYPVISAHDAGTVYIYGYGALDLTNLDRGERRGMVFTYVDSVNILGAKLINPCEWGIVFYRCGYANINDVDVYGYRQNSDAFDICNSRNITLTRCFARTGDDCFVVKTLGGDENAVTDNVTVQNCYAWASKARAFGIFGEANRDFNNITFKNSTVLCHDATWDATLIPAIGIITVSSDNPNVVGNVSNVTFDNIEICRNEASPINCISSLPNTMHDLTFNNIRFPSNNKSKGYPIRFEWFNNGNIYNVTFTDVFCGDTEITCTRDGKRTGNWETYLKDAVSCWIIFEKNS